MKPSLLISRAQSTMVSTWDEMLGIERIGDGKWRIGTYGYDWVANIYDVIPEEELYDDKGDIRVPEEWNGHKIIGLADGEYLESDELVSKDDEVEFDAQSLHLADEYCRRHGWNATPTFPEAWRRLQAAVLEGGVLESLA